MKRAIRVLTVILVVLEAVLPFGFFICRAFGYFFEPFSYTVYAWILAAFSADVLVLHIFGKEETSSKLCLLSAPLSMLTLAVYEYVHTFLLTACNEISGVIALTVYIICSIALTVVYGKPKWAEILISALSILLTAFLLFCGLIFFLPENTARQVVTSPKGTYQAEVFDRDGGAAGGATIVRVRNTGSLNLLIYKVSAMPKQVYNGHWGEFYDMQLTWKDEKHLVITKRAEYTSGEEFTDIEINLNTVE